LSRPLARCPPFSPPYSLAQNVEWDMLAQLRFCRGALLFSWAVFGVGSGAPVTIMA